MKNSLKNIENRKNEILIYINQHDFADVDTLTTRFGVSRVTIRKDLDQMAKGTDHPYLRWSFQNQFSLSDNHPEYE